jgi:hypothetical protein
MVARLQVQISLFFYNILIAVFRHPRQYKMTGSVHWALSVCEVCGRFGPFLNPNIWVDIAGTSCARCPSAHACRCLTPKTRDGARRSRRAWRAFRWSAGARTAGTWSQCQSFRCGKKGVWHWPDIAGHPWRAMYSIPPDYDTSVLRVIP